MKTVNIEVKNITLKEIANGKVFDNKEAVGVAKRILSAKRGGDFNKYRFFYPGANASQADLLDCLLDYQLFAAEVKLFSHGKQINNFLGFSKEDTLQALYSALSFSEEEGYSTNALMFSVRGFKGKLPFVSTYFHYCFADGELMVNQLLTALKEYSERDAA